MNVLNVAVISGGGAGRAHARRIDNSRKARLTAIFDPNEEILKGLPRFGARDLYLTTDFARIINDTQIDAVCICSPDGTHSDYAVSAIKAGKHVLVEKPMVTTMEQCQALASALSVSDVTFGVHHQMRYVPCYIKARDLLLDGAIGRPFMLTAEYMHHMRERASRYDNWRLGADCHQSVLLGSSSHIIDLARWIIGEQVEEVFSYATHLAWPEYPDDDTVVTLIKFASGQIANIVSTIASSRQQLNSLSIFGPNGTIVNNMLMDEKGLLDIFHKPREVALRRKMFRPVINRLLRKDGTMCSYPFPSYEHETACARVLDDFLDCILQKRSFPIDFREGAYTVQICLASAESYRKGTPIKVERVF